MSRRLDTVLEAWPTEQLVGLVHGGIDEGKVKGLVAAIKGGQTMPGVFLLVQDRDVSIIDGHHRVTALAAAGVDKVQCIVFRAR